MPIEALYAACGGRPVLAPDGVAVQAWRPGSAGDHPATRAPASAPVPLQAGARDGQAQPAAPGAAPEALPPDWRKHAPPRGSSAYARHIADFIAGMTDRFALAEHRRLFDATPDLR